MTPVIRNTKTVRQLLLNGQVQGASYLKPDASVVCAGLTGPGPVPACRYMLGWLLAGLHNPAGSGLMIGLGSGAGAIGLLYSFPDVDLTIIEISPEVVKVAIEAFPLLQFYMDMGRLDIRVQDAKDLVVDTKFDFGCCDAYTGEDALVKAVVEPCIKASKQFWCNTIATQTTAGSIVPDITGQFLATKIPESFADVMLANWVVTNAELDWEKIDSYVPYSDLNIDEVEDDWIELTAKNYV